MERKNTEKSKVLIKWFLIMIIILQGCAGVTPPTNIADDKIVFKQCKEDTSKLWWEKQGFDWHNYDRIMVEPIIIKMDKNKFKPGELKTAVKDFQKTITERLSPEYLVVNEPGPSVLRLRSVITDINTSNPALNLLTTLAIFVPLDMGGATIEVEFFNSMTGERVAAMVDQKTGTPLQLKSGFSRFGHAKGAFEDWAKELKLALITNP